MNGASGASCVASNESPEAFEKGFVLVSIVVADVVVVVVLAVDVVVVNVTFVIGFVRMKCSMSGECADSCASRI